MIEHVCTAKAYVKDFVRIFNPRCILQFTATPTVNVKVTKKRMHIIARELKTDIDFVRQYKGNVSIPVSNSSVDITCA